MNRVFDVNPGPSQRVRPKVAGLMTGSAGSPESESAGGDYGFPTCHCAAIRNDEIGLPDQRTDETRGTLINPRRLAFARTADGEL